MLERYCLEIILYCKLFIREHSIFFVFFFVATTFIDNIVQYNW